jgi:hypothetical protein
MRFVVVLFVCIGAFLVSPQLGSCIQEDARLESISHTTENGNETLQFELTGAHIPQVFMMPGEMPRLVLDFPETSYKGPMQLKTEGAILVRGIRIGLHSTPKLKTRVVVDLSTARKVNWSQDFTAHKNLLVVTLSDGGENVSADTGTPAGLQQTVQKVKHDPAVESVQDDASTPPTPPAPSVETLPVAVPAEEGSDDNTPLPAENTEPVLLDVSFDNVYAKTGEMVLFKLNGYYPPDVSAADKGDPRIICNFRNTRIGDGVQDTITAGGEYVDRIRVSKNEAPAGVSVVLELSPGKDYDLEQVFFKEENLFVLIVNILPDEAAK